MTNFYPYLKSISQEYESWWEFYTITDVEGEKQREKQHKSPMFDFTLRGKIVNPKLSEEDREEEKEKTEILPILEGLRKYKDDHVLLSGKPGSGKSTALLRLILEESQSILKKFAYQEENQRFISPKDDFPSKIPILVELRYYRSSILDLIQAFFDRHAPNLNLDREILSNYLKQGNFFLLIDGINELPSQSARDDLFHFRQSYQKTTPMIFTTRDLGVGGDFKIEKKLEMQPLTEKQMEEFVKAYLAGKGEEMLQKIKQRLREFGQTPLLLKMLCDLYGPVKDIPDNLGEVFRIFTQQYDQKIKADVPVSADSRNFWGDMPQELAGKMMQGEKDKPTEIKVAISKYEAEVIIRKCLKEAGEPDSLGIARSYKVFFPFVSIPVETIRGFLEAS